MFKKVFCLLLIMSISPVLADITNYNYRKPISNNFSSKLNINRRKNIISEYPQKPTYNHRRSYPECNYYNHYLSEKNLSALEKYALKRTFKRENNLRRLERLENLAFGTIQNGDLISRYQNVENAILTRPQYSQKQNLINNIASYFNGTPTGFTPNIMPYSNIDNIGGFSNYPSMYSPKYGNTKFEQYSNGIFGGGWGINNSSFGTGSTVRILD